MDFLNDIPIHMLFALLMTAFAVYSFAAEKISLELTSLIVMAGLALYGHFFPLMERGENMMSAGNMFAGLANPSLIAIMALLVMGQGIMQTDVLSPITRGIARLKGSHPILMVLPFLLILVFVLGMSAFMNNTPLVILAIPIMQALAHSFGSSESRLMMPLSFAAILGGMVTLIGSSTNLLVSTTMASVGYDPLSFFAFTEPGLIMAGVGLVYVFFIMPWMLPDRSSMTQDLMGDEKEFIAELDATEASNLVGMEIVDGKFTKMPDLNIRLIQRKGHLILPPFEGYVIEEGDVIIVAATRETLTRLLTKYPGFLLSEDEKAAKEEGDESNDDDDDGNLEDNAETRMLAEVMITPTSRFLDMAIEQVDLPRQFGVTVLGIQRRARAVRRKLGRIRLESGDVLLVAGTRSDLDSMQHNPDIIVLSGSKKVLPLTKKAPIAGLIFLATIGLAAANIITIPIAAVTGATLMLLTGCLNLNQASRALNKKIFLLVAAMLALGKTMEVTGAAELVATSILETLHSASPIVVLAVLFGLVAFTTNVLTNNACAILFTPIALSIAQSLDADPFLFAITVIFASNCSFATPVGYQTNLLVMGPGHYRFRDFFRTGVPLILLLWLTFIGILYFYYGLRF